MQYLQMALDAYASPTESHLPFLAHSSVESFEGFFVCFSFISSVHKKKCLMVVLQPDSAPLQDPWVSVVLLDGKKGSRYTPTEL